MFQYQYHLLTILHLQTVTSQPTNWSIATSQWSVCKCTQGSCDWGYTSTAEFWDVGLVTHRMHLIVHTVCISKSWAALRVLLQKYRTFRQLPAAFTTDEGSRKLPKHLVFQRKSLVGDFRREPWVMQPSRTSFFSWAVVRNPHQRMWDTATLLPNAGTGNYWCECLYTRTVPLESSDRVPRAHTRVTYVYTHE